MGREGGRHNQQNTRSHDAPICGHSELNVLDNPEAVLTAIKPSLLLSENVVECLLSPLIGVGNPCQKTRSRWSFPIASSEILPYIYNSDQPETKTVVPRMDTAPNVVETTTSSVDR